MYDAWTRGENFSWKTWKNDTTWEKQVYVYKMIKIKSNFKEIGVRLWDVLSWLCIKFSTILVNKMQNFVRYEVSTQVAMKSTTSWDVTPCTQTEVYRSFGGKYYFILKMEAASPSETSGDLYWITRCYIPEDTSITLQGNEPSSSIKGV
jgi:hypothetical protein